MSAVLLFGTASAQSAVTEFVVPEGPVIVLQDGRTIDGHIVRIDQTNVVIRKDDGTAETLPRATVESLNFETVTGKKLVGELVGWTPGIYQIATPEAAIKVFSTMPATPEPVGTAIAAGGTQAVEDPATGVGQGGSPPTATLAAERTAATEGTVTDPGSGAPDDFAGTQEAAVTPTADLSIEVSVENSKESGPPVVFNIQLSKPSENSVVLIYSTIDGTAIDGQDYEADRGVVVIKPGEQLARIEAPVIDDTELEEQEYLQLFLTVDPTVAIVENRQIIATIDDDDQG